MDQDAIITRIKAAMTRQGVNRAWLAHETKISESTLDKSFSRARPMSRPTILKIEDALNISLETRSEPSSVAPEEYGGYSKLAKEWLAGDYVAIRYARKTRGALFSFHLEIEWDTAEECLVFRTSRYKDGPYETVGRVSVPAQRSHIQLISSRLGDFDLITLQGPDFMNALRGIHLTTENREGSWEPKARKLALMPLDRLSDWTEADYGRVDAADRRFAQCHDILEPRRFGDALE